MTSFSGQIHQHQASRKSFLHPRARCRLPQIPGSEGWLGQWETWCLSTRCLHVDRQFMGITIWL